MSNETPWVYPEGFPWATTPGPVVESDRYERWADAWAKALRAAGSPSLDWNEGSSYTPAELSAYTAGYDAGEQEAYADAAEWREVALGALAAGERWRALAVVTLLALLIVAVWA